jgi:hypothetical protein
VRHACGRNRLAKTSSIYEAPQDPRSEVAATLDMRERDAASQCAKKARRSCASIAGRGARPSLSVAEEIDEREGDADGNYAADQNRENAASERPLARRVRGYDLRPFTASQCGGGSIYQTRPYGCYQS